MTRQWRHVDFDAGWLRLEPGETKNGEGRMFPLTPKLRTILERQRERTEAVSKETGRIVPWVFHRSGRPIRSTRRTWLTACLKAGFAQVVSEKPRKVNLLRIPHATSVGRRSETSNAPAVPRSTAIADEGMLRDGGTKLEALHQADQPAERTVIPLSEAPKRA